MAAALGVAAGLVGGVLGFGSQAWAQSFARGESSKARRFARWQMANRHQLQVQDLRAAGLNPILSASQPGPMATPPIMAAGTAPTGMAGGLVESARAAMTMESEVERAHQEAARVGAEGAKAEEAVRMMREQERLISAQTEQTMVGTALQATGLAGAKAQETFDKTKLGNRLRMLNRAIRAIRGADTTTAK